MNDYKRLIVWQKSIDLAEQIYCVVLKLPDREKYGLADQLRRAAVSVPSNIAEGSKRESQKEFAQFLQIAAGSLAEVETQLILVNKLYRVGVQHVLDELAQVGKMLYVFSKRLRSATKTNY